MSRRDLDLHDLASLSPAVLATIPAASPPPYISKPNFLNPPSQVPVTIGVGTLFFGLATFCYIIRIYTKTSLIKKLSWDDLTCSLGFVCSVVFYAAVIISCKDGGAGRHIWDLHLDQLIHPAYLRADYIVEVIISPGLWFIKSTLFIQYYVLFKPLRWMRVCVWTGMTVSAFFYLPGTIVGFVLGSPWPGQTLLEDIYSLHYFEFTDWSIPLGVIGMLIDWYLFVLPIPAVMGLQMSITKRLGVLLLFMTGAVAAVASTASLIYRVELQGSLANDFTWGTGYVLLLTQIEMFVGITVCSMHSVYKLFSTKRQARMTRSKSTKSGIMRLKEAVPKRKGSGDDDLNGV